MGGGSSSSLQRVGLSPCNMHAFFTLQSRDHKIIANVLWYFSGCKLQYAVCSCGRAMCHVLRTVCKNIVMFDKSIFA